MTERRKLGTKKRNAFMFRGGGGGNGGSLKLISFVLLWYHGWFFFLQVRRSNKGPIPEPICWHEVLVVDLESFWFVTNLQIRKCGSWSKRVFVEPICRCSFKTMMRLNENRCIENKVVKVDRLKQLILRNVCWIRYQVVDFDIYFLPWILLQFNIWSQPDQISSFLHHAIYV